MTVNMLILAVLLYWIFVLLNIFKFESVSSFYYFSDMVSLKFM